jgi:hypothetical protein
VLRPFWLPAADWPKLGRIEDFLAAEEERDFLARTVFRLTRFPFGKKYSFAEPKSKLD